MKYAIAILGGCAALLCSASPSLALSCMQPEPYYQSIYFTGTVTSAKLDRPPSKGELVIQQMCTLHLHVRVDEAWAGAQKGDVLQVDQQQWMCGGDGKSLIGKPRHFALDGRKNEQGAYQVGMCSGLFFEPYDAFGKLRTDFLKRVDALNTKGE